MNKTKILTISLLLATLAVGCHKDKVDGGYMRIFAENFSSGNNTKEQIDPVNLNSQPQWVIGDYINFDGANYQIGWNDILDCYTISTSVSSVTTDMRGIYPGSEGNNYDVEITGNNMVINSLDINLGDNCAWQETAFPMVAQPVDNGEELSFQHVSGGFRFQVTNNTGADIDVADLKIVLWGSSYTTNATWKGVSVRWAKQGELPLPQAAIGASQVDMNLNYSSEMNFVVRNEGNLGYTIANGQTMTFCVPVTLGRVQYFTMIGKNVAGQEVFNKSAFLTSSKTVERNKIYPIPAITLN